MYFTPKEDYQAAISELASALPPNTSHVTKTRCILHAKGTKQGVWGQARASWDQVVAVLSRWMLGRGLGIPLEGLWGRHSLSPHPGPALLL